ncbi:MAG: FHA domain-containing protein [Myxococcota bacterium]|nr:FHA domain-containing protein [Myxococcota bacterium]
MEMRPNAPRAIYRPRGEAVLIFERHGSQQVLPLDLDVVPFPPSTDIVDEPQAGRAIISRVANGHRLLVYGGGGQVAVNGKPVTQSQFLQDGDHISADNFSAAYRDSEVTSTAFQPIVLCICPPDGPMVEIRSQRRELVIGRTEGDVIIEDPALDDVHCILTRADDGQLQIEDCASQHGVFVDGIRIFGQDRLREGSAVHIGDTRVMARIEKVLASKITTSNHTPVGGPSGATRHRSAVIPGPSKYRQDVRRTFSDDMPTRMEHRQDLSSMGSKESTRHRKAHSIRIPGPAKSHTWAPLTRHDAKQQSSPDTLTQIRESMGRRPLVVDAATRYDLKRQRFLKQRPATRTAEPDR